MTSTPVPAAGGGEALPVGRDWSLVSLEAKLDRLVALQEAANRIEAEKVEVLAAIAVDRDRRILADCPDED
ncbi:MAG TPA: hypothetical protein PLP55_13160, partial [Phycicoccus elongatus]|uniref:hypothetical protein n=1 Tax=Phycicoccus elongatus TaxID=101689 RepID=UPI002CCB9AE0